MRNSHGGLGDIPSPGRAGAPPASTRSRRTKAREQASGPKSRAFRQRVIAVCRALPWCDLTPKHRGRHCAPGRRLSRCGPGLADEAHTRPESRGSRPAKMASGESRTLRGRKTELEEDGSNLYGAFPVKRLFWVVLTVFCSERERPFFVPSPAIRFAERAQGVEGPKC